MPLVEYETVLVSGYGQTEAVPYHPYSWDENKSIVT